MADLIIINSLGKSWNTFAITAMLKEVSIEPLGRPEEIADAVLWLCRPASSLVAGQTLVEDGGFSIH
jgi:NAD(P)-dependent dehydrogenase (short-subunit alcohol dehydrogenase family)